VSGYPISNNAGVLTLGDGGNTTVTCLNFNVTGQLDAPLAVVDSVSTAELIPSAGVGQSVLLGGYLDTQNYGLKNVDTLTLRSGVTGAYNQVLSVGVTGGLLWKNDANDVANWSTYTSVSDVTLRAVDKINFGTNANLYTDHADSLVTDNQFAASYVYATFEMGTAGNLYNTGEKNSMCLEDSTGLAVLLAQKSTNTLISQTNATLSGLNTVSCGKLLPTYKLSNVYYVSSNGTTGGNGSIENPYDTIQHAINVCEALTTTDNVYRYIMVQAGTYTENLEISKKINLVGLGTSPFSSGVGCTINGTMTITIDANGSDMFNNACCLSGFLITNCVTFDSTVNSMLNIENCYIYSHNDASGRALYFNPSATNSRLRVTNTQIVSGGTTGLNPLVEVTKSGSVTMSNVILNSKGLQNVLKFSGTATCDTITNCKFESDVVSAVAPAIVSVTSTNSATYTFNNCGFLYGDTTSKAASAVSSGICCSGVSGNPRVVILYCSFFLFGTTVANYAVQDTNYGTGTAMACLYYMNNASLTNAFSIHAILNTNKFQLNIVS